eukprot:CAMPEP_0177620436 /NCGR_PEP_ID=MMETSP0419_2-20121207/26902_1 /TAXON_ID=582737 /ORGANISM="Tetraselmis sp., Strain GSL018" /LENGTH=31 /DNA_ID= /DNA_START= /DNA_END= /DNA_ORIENTATION=
MASALNSKGVTQNKGYNPQGQYLQFELHLAV